VVLVLVREVGMEQKTRTDSSSKGRENERRVVGRQQYIGWQTSFRAPVFLSWAAK
jgi:hypothetical protein